MQTGGRSTVGQLLHRHRQSKSRSKSRGAKSGSRPRTDVAAYLKQKTQKEDAARDEQAKKDREKARRRKAREDAKAKKAEDAARLKRHRKWTKEQEAKELAAKNRKRLQDVQERGRKLKTRSRVKSRSVSPTRSRARPDLRAAVGRTGTGKRGRTASLASFGRKAEGPKKRLEVRKGTTDPQLSGKKRGGRHGYISDSEMSQWKLSQTTDEALRERTRSLIGQAELRKSAAERDAKRARPGRSVSRVPPPRVPPPRVPEPSGVKEAGVVQTVGMQEYRRREAQPIDNPRYRDSPPKYPGAVETE